MPRQPVATGVFGESPQAIQQSIQQQRLAKAAQIGSLGHAGRGALAGMGATQAVGGLFGQDMTDPRLQRAKVLKEIENQVRMAGLQAGTREFTEAVGKLITARLGVDEGAKAWQAAASLEREQADMNALRQEPTKQAQAEGLMQILTGKLGYDTQTAAAVAQHPDIAKAVIKDRLSPEALTSKEKNYRRALQEGFKGTFMDFMKATGPKGVSVSYGAPGQPPGKLPTGYMWKDRNNYDLGAKPIEGAGSDDMTPENAGRTAMVQLATENLTELEQLLRPGGQIDRVNVAAMQAQVPGTSGAEARSLMIDTLEAKLRVETGAAAPDTEVGRLMDRFMPKAWDKDSLINSKLRRLKRFMALTLRNIDPSGRYLTESPEQKMARLVGAAQAQGILGDPEQGKGPPKEYLDAGNDPGDWPYLSDKGKAAWQ